MSVETRQYSKKCTQIIFVAAALLIQLLSGCSDSTSTAPTANQKTQPSKHYQLSFRRIYVDQADDPNTRSLHPYSFFFEQSMFEKKIDQRVWRYLDHWHYLRSVNGQTVDLELSEIENSDKISLKFILYQPATTYGGDVKKLNEKLKLTPNQWTWINLNPESKLSPVRSQIKIQRQ
jgi:hypothetical protein